MTIQELIAEMKENPPRCRVLVNHEYLTGVEFVKATRDTREYINISTQ